MTHVTGSVHNLDTGRQHAEFQENVVGASYANLDLHYDAEGSALWYFMKHGDRPCFHHGLVEDIRDVQARIQGSLTGLALADMPLKFLVFGSRSDDVFCMGGDLSLFAQLIRSGDAARLRDYAHGCIETLYPNSVGLNLPVVTVAFVRGDALGGGFEAALGHDLIAAEAGSRFGLPEIVFNLFPGMGAYSFLARKLGGAMAERMIRSGKVYSAEEMHELGVVDILLPAGEGEATLAKHLLKMRRQHPTLLALRKARQRATPVAYEELIDITDLWVETAMCLTEADLKRMERLAAAQVRRQAQMRQPMTAAA